MSLLKNISTEKLELIITLLSILFILSISQYGVILSFVIVFIYLRRSKEKASLLKSIGLDKPRNIFTIIVTSLILGILIELTTEIIFNPIIEKMTNSKIDLTKVDIDSFGKYLAWIVIGFVLGGFLEEILFRGFLFTRISKFLKAGNASDLLALFATSILFGLCHFYQGVSGAISTGIVGLILGIIFLASKKNLWYAILTHGFVDMTALTILYFGLYDKLANLVF